MNKVKQESSLNSRW